MKPRTFSPFRNDLEATVERYGLPRGSVEIVESIRDYCAKIGQPELETSDSRIAKCLISTEGEAKFLLCDHADPSDGMMPLIARKFPDHDIRLLNDPKAFAKHQLLHEVAHHLRRDLHSTMHRGDVERDCDQWAFEELKKA